MLKFKEFISEQKDEEEKWVIAFLGKMHKVAEINEDKVKPVTPLLHMIYHKDKPYERFAVGETREQAIRTYRGHFGSATKKTKLMKADTSFMFAYSGMQKSPKYGGYVRHTINPKIKWRTTASGYATTHDSDHYMRFAGNSKKLNDIHNELSIHHHEPSDAAKAYSSARGVNEYLVNQHTGGKASQHNRNFTDSTKHNPEHEEIIKGLKETIAKHKLHRGMWLHTGTSFSPARHHDGKSSHIHIHLPAFTSTSISSSEASTFSQADEQDDGEHAGYRHTIHIHANSGTNAYYVGDHSNYPHEKEMILHPGARVRLKAKPKVNHERKEVHWHGKLVHDGIKDVSKPEPKPDFSQHF